MFARTYLRIGLIKGKHAKIVASKNPLAEPLYTGSGRWKKYLPTVQICLDLDINDSAFDLASASLKAKIENAEPCVDIRQVERQEDDERD